MPVRPTAAPRALLLLAALSLPLAACSESSTEPEPDPGATIAVDATGNVWGYLDLATTPVVTREAPTSETAWDMAFNATAVMLNGGEDGPGGVVGLCLCQNEQATDEQVLAMTAAGELADFEAVTAADVPPATDARWSAEVFDEKKWYRYNLIPGTHQISPTFEVFLIRRGNEVYKVQLINYYNAATVARHITVRYARLAG